MAKTGSKRVQESYPQPQLKVVEKPNVVTKPYNDINLNSWKDYAHVKTDTWWEFASRDKTKGHSNEYHGNYIPQIAQQLYERFTKKDDIVLDLFLGSGTSAIEAVNMGRKCIGVELKEELAEHVKEKFSPKELVTDINIICADSTTEDAKEKIQARLDILGEKKAQFLMLHPPYDDIIKFSDLKQDLSNCSNTEEFYELFQKVAKNGYELLEKKRYAALIIGDKYANSQIYPLGSECAKKMNELGFITKAIIVKNIEGNEKAKGKTANLWRYRALNGGFYFFKHEYIYIFQKI
jgi:16S rRNA G966 N2-methylase RsmD